MCSFMRQVYLFYLEICTHKHSHDNINNDNDYKTVDVVNEVESVNAPENNVGGVF